MSEIQEEYWGMPEKTYCMLIHLSQLTSVVAPGLGLVIPIVMWAMNKDKSKEIDQHGKVTLNWIISLAIYSIICVILWIFLIGALAFLVLAILNFVFAIMAAIKANKGELWVYPMSITFLKYK
ncbi:DUF4870 domain-containing protein [uncultured Neptuniibacter sp.]|uniref:DUF4870 domain-containing protein n=1 Tax=uncultured Neptuniibacter sp. TaxID=502143 RepID=UPI0026258140|nr:DUF4870 domain-containing protein [uncultured Neptuniibacter sp.]